MGPDPNAEVVEMRSREKSEIKFERDQANQ